MSIFGKIKDAIFGKKAAPAPVPTSGGTAQSSPNAGAPQLLQQARPANLNHKARLMLSRS